MVPHPLSSGSNGLCFIMTPTPALNAAFATQYLGLVNLSSNGKDYNHLFAVEFDTSKSIGMEDKDDNHVEIDYNGESKQLDISIVPVGEARPQKALLSRKDLDFDGIIQDQMWVGFSASTDSSPLVEDPYILARSFVTGNTKTPDLDIWHLPSFYVRSPKFYNSMEFIYIIVICSAAFILGLILGIFYWFKRTDYIDFTEQWELECWPHRFAYRELNLSTKGFRDDNLLGYGDFGWVYRGTLPSGEEIAIKCITKDFTEEMEEFMAEISSLRGWSRKKKRLFIVYDYMCNGSLERNLFSPKLSLTWAHRYKILTDVATGLLYLHEQWDKCVVHRDIKSSNVLLDTDQNSRVGDFGLARCVQLWGSYAGGCLRKETCRCPRNDLVQWVWDLYANKRLVDVVDQRLGGDYDKGEAENVLVLGLVCSNPDPRERISMRNVLQILSRKAALPVDLNVPLAFKHFYIDIAEFNLFRATSLELS
ncbi:L-type lectin-domain containing receptor kinase S.4-like [Cryptomeria japonica]|uniref:L-type lectin-domain containing receptor kinase S.4-like n=1 Tax=Cryptomeria japonica TaxID=3369 RepID=UPI0027DA8202|nr:L-type lectin-domain containing receptor kinase S.4-like [Cryptomeria japonica]